MAAADRLGPMDELFATGEAYRALGARQPDAVPGDVHPCRPRLPRDRAALARASLSFDAHVARVARAIDSGDLAEHDAIEIAMHVWATVHGYVMLELMQMQPPTRPSRRRATPLASPASSTASDHIPSREVSAP